MSKINIKTPPILEEAKTIYFTNKPKSRSLSLLSPKHKKTSFVMHNLKNFDLKKSEILINNKMRIFNGAKIEKFEIKINKKTKKSNNISEIRGSKYYENFEIRKRICRLANCKHDNLIN